MLPCIPLRIWKGSGAMIELISAKCASAAGLIRLCANDRLLRYLFMFLIPASAPAGDEVCKCR